MPVSHGHDPFARESVKRAHQRILLVEKEAREAIARVEATVSRRSAFMHRCHLCGDPVRKGSRYCHAHSWAEGTG